MKHSASSRRTAPVRRQRSCTDFPERCFISVNDEVVHGIPGSRRLQRGDVVKLDVTLEKDGYMADAARTIIETGPWSLPPKSRPAERKLDRLGQVAHNMGHMAQMPTASLHDHPVGPPTKDLERFRQYLRRGAPGPHAYVILLGLETFDPPDLLRAVAKGLPYRTFERFQRNTSLSFERAMALIDIPRRTMTRRKREGRFLPDESDRLLRASRLFGKTLQLFEGDRDAATEWLTTAQPALGGAVPVEVAKSEVGASEVERLVGRLEHGVYL